MEIENHFSQAFKIPFADGSTEKPRTVFECIERFGSEMFFEPLEMSAADYEPTGARPGTDEKIEVLRGRVERGEPLWHENDPECFNRFASTLDDQLPTVFPLVPVEHERPIFDNR